MIGFKEKALTNGDRKLIYLGACLIVGIRLARETQVMRTVPVERAIEESAWLAGQVFQKVSRNMEDLLRRPQP